MEPGSQPRLSNEEYQRRKLFLDQLKRLNKPEYIEIVRILQKHKVDFSENQNGIFFNVVYLAQEVFDDLMSFIQFTQTNQQELVDRDRLMSTLTTMTKEG
jgi:hypothetical protein